MKTTVIALSDIEVVSKYQPRQNQNADTIAAYAEAFAAGAEFPPIVVFKEGSTYWLADGLHRTLAATEAGIENLSAEVHKGGARDAFLYAAGSNETHGLRRTNADKRRVVSIMLEDEEWKGWSDQRISKQAGVSDRFVAKLREELSPNRSEIADRARTVSRGGTTYTQNTANIGRSQRDVDMNTQRLIDARAAAREIFAKPPKVVDMFSGDAAPKATRDPSSDAYFANATPVIEALAEIIHLVADLPTACPPLSRVDDADRLADAIEQIAPRLAMFVDRLREREERDVKVVR